MVDEGDSISRFIVRDTSCEFESAMYQRDAGSTTLDLNLMAACVMYGLGGCGWFYSSTVGLGVMARAESSSIWSPHVLHCARSLIPYRANCTGVLEAVR